MTTGASEPTLRDTLVMYRDRISILKKGYAQEKYRIDQMCRMDFSNIPVRSVTTVEIAAFRDTRLTTVNPRTGKPVTASTVRLDLALLSDMFRVAEIEWGLVSDNPVLKVRKPKLPPGRDRRLLPREEKLIRRYCMQHKMHEMNVIITLALETAARQSEILNLTWCNVNLRSRIARLPDTKNGTARDIPMTFVARDALMSMGVQPSGRIFRYTSSGIKSSWRHMIRKLGLVDLHFHDLRHEGISRLVERGVFDLMEVAAISGHKSLSMLKRYTHLRAQRLVRKLDAGTNKGKAVVLSQLVPYPVHIRVLEGEYRVVVPDFDDLHGPAACREDALNVAQNLLLRRLMTLFRLGEPIPPPDNYLDSIQESEIVWIDPLGHEVLV